MIDNSKYKALFLKESEERLENISRLLFDLEDKEIDSEPLESLFREFHSIKGMASSMGFEGISELSHRLEDLLDLHRKGHLSFSEETLDLLTEGEDTLRSMIKAVEEDVPCEGNPAPLVERLERLIQTDSHEGSKKERQEEKMSSKIATRDVEEQKEQEVWHSKDLRLPSTIKIKTSTIDDHINLLGELISSKSRLIDISRVSASYQFREELHTLETLLRGFYYQILEIRLLPFDNVALGLAKLVRDVSKKQGKKIEFSIKGGDIRLDRAILERTIDPLIHILRNAIDHGIEGAEERRNLGKPQKGRIEINLSREKEGVIIEISDDGKGIDPQKIKEKALSLGLISSKKADRLKDRDILLLTCLPGFSLSERVTQVSGRGVGMDVVKTIIEEMSGRLKIESEINKGTKITLFLPITISFLKFLLISLHDEVFAIPFARIDRIMELNKDDIKRGDHYYYISSIRRKIPLLSLRKVLRMSLPNEKADTLPLVLVDMKDRRFGLIVDGIFGEKEAYVKPLRTPLDKIKGISGYTLMGDGKPVFLLDLNNLLNELPAL